MVLDSRIHESILLHDGDTTFEATAAKPDPSAEGAGPQPMSGNALNGEQ